MSDLIDRQAAIDAEPTIKPERKTGKWIHEIVNNYTEKTYCSECGESAPFVLVSDDYYGVHVHGEDRKTNFCPNCGADMRGKAMDTIYRQKAIDEIEYELEMINSALDSITLDFNARERLRQRRDEAKEKLNSIQQLSPAQPEPIRINLNEPIKVKLTDWGKEIYYHQYDRTNQIAGREICKPKFPKEDENGYTEFQLWCFIELYGEHMGMTLPNVIEPLEIVYERREK